MWSCAFEDALENKELISNKSTWVAIVHAILLPLTHFHCTYEVTDEYIVFL